MGFELFCSIFWPEVEEGCSFSSELFTHLMILALSLRAITAQEPNTDGFYVNEFIKSMKIHPTYSNSSSICPSEVSCSVRGKDVVGLVASGPRFAGDIPDNTVGKLNKLEFLILTDTSITGLPSDFWGLGNSLRNLNLSFNRIEGPLQNEIGNLGKLESLDLSHNSFSGQIPMSIGSLSRLRYLYASMNGFEGSIPTSILGCKALITVDLSFNNLSGPLPNEFGSAFRALNALNLAGNKIMGRLPSFASLQSITNLNLSGNQFEGPVTVLPHKSLQTVDLSNNKLSGNISQVSLDSSPSLFHLDISDNNLSGRFFKDLDKARTLKHLNLAWNRFSLQELPPILGKLSKLEYLNLSRTSITGKIPTHMSKLVNLEVLDLSSNHLVGQIPPLSIENLKVLDLSRNNLTGEIPLSLQEKLLNMSKFNFSFNNLSFCSSKFPPELLESAFKGYHDNCPIAANPDTTRSKGSHRWGKLAVALALSVIFLITGLACFAFAYKQRHLRDIKKVPSKEEAIASGPFSFETDSTTWVADIRDATSVSVVIFEKPLLNFTFADLLLATSNFDRGTLLAEGRFGPVYRGLLPEGIHVAVKVLVHGSTLTDQEAAAEFERIGRIKHLNLVPLSGYCLAGEQRIAIYEYMEHGNLQNLLHDLPLGIQATEDWSNDTWEDDNDGVQSITSEGQTTWRFRHRIALGTARALAFLHHGCIPQIIHRDVKASSIYLDSTFEPRLSDFGLAKIVGSDFEDEISRGSPGYTPPELCGTEPISASSKSDVYGFGVVLFELFTGKKPIGDEYPGGKDSNLVSWIRGLLKKNQASDAIDPKIHGTGQEKQMEEALRIGYLCTAESPSKRPSMQQVVGLLKDIEPSAVDQ